MILPNKPSYPKSEIDHSTSCNWFKPLSFGVTDIDNNKGSIYVDGRERADVVAYRKRFCKRWFDLYLPKMESYEGPEMVEIPPELAGQKSNTVTLFHDEIKFNSNEDRRYYRLEK